MDQTYDLYGKEKLYFLKWTLEHTAAVQGSIPQLFFSWGRGGGGSIYIPCTNCAYMYLHVLIFNCNNIHVYFLYYLWWNTWFSYYFNRYFTQLFLCELILLRFRSTRTFLLLSRSFTSFTLLPTSPFQPFSLPLPTNTVMDPIGYPE
jgi:hypothetical protein